MTYSIIRGYVLRASSGIVFITMLLAYIAAAEVQVDSCAEISIPGYYTLNTSITDSSEVRCIIISSSNVFFDGNGYLIDGIRMSDSTGVSIISSDYSEGLYNVSVVNLNLTDWDTGISSEGSMFSSHGNMYGNISNNTIDVPFGIRISYSGNYTIARNNAGMALHRSSGNIIFENNASSKGGIHITYSVNNILESNNASLNDYGIYMSYAEGNLIANNTITGSVDSGIILSEPSPSNNTLINNVVSNNRYGIEIAGGGSGNIISGNKIILNSECGISVASSGNLIYNNFFKNSKNMKAKGKNKLHIKKKPGQNIIGGSFIGGNYWEQPDGKGFSQTCTDHNKDGLCDIRYKASRKNIDYLPMSLMNK